MKRKLKIQPPVTAGQKIKLRLNNRTIIIVRTMDAVRMWLKKYPQATIMP